MIQGDNVGGAQTYFHKYTYHKFLRTNFFFIIYERPHFSLLKRSTYVHESFETIIPITIDKKM